uniref:Uncharacterized protein n=1 Tax=Prymnesium polylepis TaxID=72548 RepID=A0A7S4MIR3_9EUKA
MSSIFAEQGANQFGIMATTRFIGSLTVNFPRFRIEEKIYLALVDAYGIGFKTPMGGWESIAWMDFCEDVDKAVDTTEGQVATRLAHSRSASLTFENLQKAPEDLVDL